MRRLLIVFPKESGGEWVAMKNIASQIHEKFPKKVRVQEVKNLQVFWDSSKRLQLASQLIKSIDVYLIIINKFKKKSIRSYYSNSLLFLWLTGIFSKIRNEKAKLNYHFHGARHGSTSDELKREPQFIRRFFYILPIYLLVSTVERHALKMSRVVFIPSASAKEQLKHLWGFRNTKKLKIIPSGYDPKIFYPKMESKTSLKGHFKLLYVGRIDPLKKIELLINSFLYLRKNLDCQLDIVFPEISDESTKEWFSNLISEKKGINLFSDLRQEDIAEHYRSADLSLLLSSKENFPLVFLESIACGTPVVTSKIASIDSLQKHIYSRLNVGRVTPQKVKEAVLSYYNLSSNKKEGIRKRCIEISKDYIWEKSANLILRTINESS